MHNNPLTYRVLCVRLEVTNLSIIVASNVVFCARVSARVSRIAGRRAKKTSALLIFYEHGVGSCLNICGESEDVFGSCFCTQST